MKAAVRVKQQLQNLVWNLYKRARLDQIERLIRLVPSAPGQRVALYFRQMIQAAIFVLLPVYWLLRLSIILLRICRDVLVFSRDLFLIKGDHVAVIHEDPPVNPVFEPSRKQVAVVVPDWPVCGSTAMYRAQIRGLIEVGCDVSLIIFADSFYYSSERDSRVMQKEVGLRQRKIYDFGQLRSVMVVPALISGRYVVTRLWWRLLRKPKLYIHCNKFQHVVQRSDQFRSFCEQLDLFIVNRVTYLNYFSRWKNRVFLETHDVMARTIEFESEKSLKYEMEISSRVPRMIGCYTKSDYAAYSKHGSGNLMISRPGMLIPAPEFHKRVVNKLKRILYIGDNHPQNVRSISSCLAYGIPVGLELTVVGRVGEALQGVDYGCGVNLKGYVSNLDAEIQAADMIIIPDFAGTGISVKALEALSWGVPVLMSRRAMRGIDIDVPECSITDAGPSEFLTVARDRASEILAVDWHRIRRSLMEQYGVDRSSSWAREVLTACES